MNKTTIRNIIDKCFLSERVVLAVVVLNAIAIFMQELGVLKTLFSFIDYACVWFFMIEMGIKLHHFGWSNYWKDGWNKADGIIVIISLPTLVMPFLDITSFNFSALLTIRLVRIFRFFRVLHFFPNISQIGRGFRNALSQSWAVLASFLILIIIFGLINCSLYGSVCPEYFSTPQDSIYSVFRIATVEGWYEIPDAITAVTSPFIGHLSRIYFCILLLSGGIIGMSLINSIFVDAMVEDNNDDIKLQLHNIEEKLNRLLEEKENNTNKNEKNNKK